MGLGMTLAAVLRTALAVAALLTAAGCDRRRNVGADAYANRVADAVPQIEKALGLKFKTPPKVDVRTRAQVREFLVQKFNESTPAEQLRGEEMAYKLFGLIPDTLDLRRFLLELLTEQIVGYYDPATKALYVVEGAPDDLTGITIMHELVHALQDQYVNLDSIQKATGNSDRQAAAQAVLEGQATYEQMEIMAGGGTISRMPGGWDGVRQMIRESQSAMPMFSAAPMAIQESLLFPYLSGAEFVRRFEMRRPGRSPLLEPMPISTEQILSDTAYFGTPPDLPIAIAFPASADSPHEETLGEFGTRLLIYQHQKNNTAAINAAHGWEGDRYRVVRSGTDRGLVWVTAWETATDAAEFVDAIGQGIVRRYGTSAPRVTRGGGRTYAGGSSGRTVVITPLERDGRHVVMYVDIPAGASPAVIDPARISIGR
jgi:hypothetical protein